MHEIQPKPLNKHMLKILGKLCFRHSCMDREEGESSSDKCDCDGEGSDCSELRVRVLKRRRLDKQEGQAADETPFEAFKKTDQYKAILKKMGKLKENESEEEDEKKKARPTKVLEDERTRDLKRLKIYPYEEYIKHLRTGDCHRLRTFKCPLKCRDQLMTHG